MGAFYNSICALDSSREEVERSLERWLGARGFEPSERPDLFDLDGDHERSAFLVSSERWVLVFFSHYDEEWRLIHELGDLGVPLVYVWVYDSEVWGYDLFVDREFAGSFNSDPRVHTTFPDQTLAAERRPLARAEQVAQTLGRPQLAAELRRLEGRRRTYPDDVCREFCRVIEAEPAAASFDALECGVADLLEGWQTRRLLFVRRDFATTVEVDLHQHPLTRWQPPARQRQQASSELEIPPELLRELRRAHRRRRLVMMALRPVSWLATTWRVLRRALSGWIERWRSFGGSEEFSELILGSSFHRHGEFLVNPRHHCRVRLPEGAEPLTSSSKPSAVFAFQLAETHVTCSARRLHTIAEVLREPARSELLLDQCYRVADQPARQLLFELPSRQGGAGQRHFLGIHILQTAVAFYVFLYRRSGAADGEVDQQVRSVVESFALDDG